MTKTKQDSPREIYRARRQRNEQERDIYLPPGLINSGNTCFMNSVLQGLIATPLLTELVEFDPNSTYKQHPWASQIEGWRSPQLTNGHGLAGKDEKAWEAGMPLGDVFVAVMHKAWSIQEKRKRENMSARDLLAVLGKKYDQYMDFGQQDAHEFLRQLLDAMSMEELDAIKKRQPPPVDKRGRRHSVKDSSQYHGPGSHPLTQLDSESHPPHTPQISEDEKLVPLTDLVFGGKLTSILVCEKCKHVSQTFEDFNDLSLSIKAEDYARGRKRDRLKIFAKKLTPFQPPVISGLESDREQRDGLVPTPITPKNESYHYVMDEDMLATPVDGQPRQFASVNASEAENGDDDTLKPVTANGSPEYPDSHTSQVLEATSVGGEIKVEEKKVDFADQLQVEKKKRDNTHEDNWSRLGRRLSLTITFGKGQKDKSGREKEREKRTRDKPRETEKLSPAQDVEKWSEESTGSSQSTGGATRSTAMTSISDTGTPRPGGSGDGQDKLRAGRFQSLNRDRLKEQRSRPLSLSPPGHTHTSATSITLNPENDHISAVKQHKIERRESEYLRSILSDITPVSSNPFALLKNSSHTTGSAALNPAGHLLWLKSGQISGLEDCLRMFTAVEILDGENMVGCRRCWKIANGVHKPRGCEDNDDSDSSAESESEGADEGDVTIQALPPDATFSNLGGKPSSAPASPIISISNDPLYNLPNKSEGMAVTSPSKISGFGSTPNLEIFPLPTAISSLESQDSRAYQGIIPTISTTAPESPDSARMSRPSKIHSRRSQSDGPSVLPRDSLKTPRVTRHPHRRTDSSSTGSSMDYTDVSTSATPSGYSSALASPATSQDHLAGVTMTKVATAPGVLSADSTMSSSSKDAREKAHVKARCKELRAKQVILRPSYKRYLIASPPPILVIHLKRFQHLSKGQSILSFSSGLKKIDDYVAFPEHLDLTPFLAPKKEDYGLGRNGRGKERKGQEVCMYRLYAVVVHIGNMLGGHYVAYTALPTSPPNTAGIPSPPTTASSTAEGYFRNKLPQRQWAYISDTNVRLATLEEVLKAKAYICMYERI